MNTNYENLKARIIENYSSLLKQAQLSPELFDEAKKALAEFKEYTPAIYLYIDGGILQGPSASESIAINLFDKDIYDHVAAYCEHTAEEWQEMIKSKTDNLEIKEIF